MRLKRKFLGLAISVGFPNNTASANWQREQEANIEKIVAYQEWLATISKSAEAFQKANEALAPTDPLDMGGIKKLLDRQPRRQKHPLETLPEPQIQIVTGKDGVQYEMREAGQRDLSIIHIDDVLVAYNQGWRRHFENGEWTGMMIRPADVETRANDLAVYLKSQEPKLLTQ